jgi:hypothetical protein
MRKAASQVLQSGVVAAVLGLFLTLVFVVSVSAYAVDTNKPVSGDGKPSDGVSGTITISGTTAQGTVTNSTNESVDVGIASYKKVTQDGIADQVYYSSKVFSVGAGQTKSVSIDIPCWSQVDLFRVYGEQFNVIKDFSNGDRYAERMLYAVHTKNECSTEQVKTVEPILECVEYGQSIWTAKWGYNNPNNFEVTMPYGTDNNFSVYGPDRGQPVKYQAGRHYNVFMTMQGENTQLTWSLNGNAATSGKDATVCGQSTPRPTASPSSESTATPAPTNPPTGGSTPVSDGRSDGLGCASHDCSGNAVGGAGSVLSASTDGRTLPSTGSLNFALYAIVGLVLGAGVAMRVKADRDESKMSK